LLTTVDVSTKDATGLHEKLDRKKSVEQHNSDAQQRFADQMEAMFTEMQTAVEQQGAKQQAMLSSYKCSVEQLNVFVLCDMERMRSESASFFRDHLRALVQLRETATAALTSLQTEQESLTQRICEASHTHATRISQVISCMEGQMRLLDVEMKSGFSGLLGLSDALQGRVASLKQTMQTECGAVEQAASARQGRAEASSSGLVTELRQVGERGQATLEESSGQVSSLQAHLSQLGQDTRQWGDTTRATVHSLSEGQLALIRDGQTSAKALQQETPLGRKGVVLEEAAGSVDPPEPWSEVHRDTVPVDLSLTPSVTQGR
ncbi:hypothetical protein AAFF_G00369850, partial [Aldrovandia affinis]